MFSFYEVLERNLFFFFYFSTVALPRAMDGGKNSTDFNPTCLTGSCTAQRWMWAKICTVPTGDTGVSAWAMALRTTATKAFRWRWIDRRKQSEWERCKGRRRQCEPSCPATHQFSVIWPRWHVQKHRSNYVARLSSSTTLTKMRRMNRVRRRLINWRIDPALSVDYRDSSPRIRRLLRNEIRQPWLQPKSKTNCLQLRAFLKRLSSAAAPKILSWIHLSIKSHPLPLPRRRGSTSPPCRATSDGVRLCHCRKIVRLRITSRKVAAAPSPGESSERKAAVPTWAGASIQASLICWMLPSRVTWPSTGSLSYLPGPLH